MFIFSLMKKGTKKIKAYETLAEFLHSAPKFQELARKKPCSNSLKFLRSLRFKFYTKFSIGQKNKIWINHPELESESLK